MVARGTRGPGGLAGRQAAERLGQCAWLAQPEGPHQPTPALSTLINGQPFGLDEFVLEGLKLVIVQAELHFEGPIRHAPSRCSSSDTWARTA